MCFAFLLAMVCFYRITSPAVPDEEVPDLVDRVVKYILTSQKNTCDSPTPQELNLSDCCNTTYQNLLERDSYAICITTLRDKNIWFRERQWRITASRCYELYTYKKEDWTKKINNYIFRKTFTNASVRHGITYETEARRENTVQNNVEVVELGLVVHSLEPWLAASPDGVVVINGMPEKLLEIKCPIKGKDASAEDVVKSCNYLKTDSNGVLCLKEKHTYYAQIQINLYVLGLEACDLVIYSPYDKSMKIISVPENIEFRKKLISKLSNIYFTKILYQLCINAN